MVSPSYWGRPFWLFFHLVSIKYPNHPTEIDKAMAKLFVESIFYMLPCTKCRYHFAKNLKANPLNDTDVNSTEDFKLWFMNFHDVVNKSIKADNKGVAARHISADEKIETMNKLEKTDTYFEDMCNVLQIISLDLIGSLDPRRRTGIINFMKCCAHFDDSKHKKKYDNCSFNFNDRASFCRLIRDLMN